jgi:hypothetical protein
MKRLFAIALLACLAACATVNGVKQTPAQALATARADVVKACKIAPALLTSVQTTTAAQPASDAQVQTLAALATIQTDLGKVCYVASTPLPGGGSALTLADVSTFVNTYIPGVLSVVNASSLTAQEKLDASIALGAIQSALLIAVANAS